MLSIISRELDHPTFASKIYFESFFSLRPTYFTFAGQTSVKLKKKTSAYIQAPSEYFHDYCSPFHYY